MLLSLPWHFRVSDREYIRLHLRSTRDTVSPVVFIAADDFICDRYVGGGDLITRDFSGGVAVDCEIADLTRTSHTHASGLEPASS